MINVERFFSIMVNYFQNSAEKLRWAFLLVFIIGYFVTFRQFSSIAIEYFTYNIFAILSCVILFYRLNSYEKYYAAIWLSLLIFIGVYFTRFYWIAIDPMPVRAMLPTPVYIIMVHDNAAIFEGFKLSVITLLTFSVSVTLMLYFFRRVNNPLPQNDKNRTSFEWFITKSLYIFIPPFMLFLAYIAHKYHIGEMGVASGDPLPFRLKGIIFYARYIMLPLLIIFMIYLSKCSDHTHLIKYGIVLLMIHGIMDMFLRGSRSGLLLSILLLIFLTFSGGLKINRNIKILGVLLVVVGIFMIPIMTEFRAHRVAGNLSDIDAIISSIYNVGSGGFGTLLRGTHFVVFRMPGIEAISSIISMGAEPLGNNLIETLKSEQGIAGYLTHYIYNIGIEVNHLAAPGFIGWFFLIGGTPAVIIGSIILSFFAVIVWNLLNNKYLVNSPVAQTFFLWMLFHVLTEGTVDSMIYMLVVGFIVLVTIELIMKFGESAYYRYSSKNNDIATPYSD